MRRTGAILLVLWLARQAAAGQAECLVRFALAQPAGDPDAPALVCRDGDPACDGDGATNGTCEIAVSLCGGPAPCDDAVPPHLTVRGKGTEALQAAAESAAATSATCSEPVVVPVVRGGSAQRRRTVHARATDASRRMHDRDRLRLTCTGPPPVN